MINYVFCEYGTLYVSVIQTCLSEIIHGATWNACISHAATRKQNFKITKYSV